LLLIQRAVKGTSWLRSHEKGELGPNFEVSSQGRDMSQGSRFFQ
jgi:hypothetical protein